MTKRIEPYLLGLAGEYRVCSELNKRGILATVTYGNRKNTDVYAIGDRRQGVLKIEVKTTQTGRFVTAITQKRLDQDRLAADFWVLVQFTRTDEGSFTDRFFVLSHREMCSIQVARNREYARKYRAKHHREPDFTSGVDNVRVQDVEQHDAAWQKIVVWFKGAGTEDRKLRHSGRLQPTPPSRMTRRRS